MSHAATNATYPVLATLPERLQELPVKRRPSHLAMVAVMLLLADKYRDQRGYVNESVAQVAETLRMTETTVRSCFAALDALGLWVRVGSGNRHAPAKRVPGFLNPEPPPEGEGLEDGVSPAAYEDVERGVSPAVNGDLERGVDGLERGVTTPRAWGQPRDTPYTTPCVTPATSSSENGLRVVVDAGGDDDLIRHHITEHITHKAFARNPIEDHDGFARWAHPRMKQVVTEARKLGENPADWLEAKWPTRHHEPEGDFDLGDADLTRQLWERRAVN